MAVKNKPILTMEDFEAALVTLRLSVSEVSRESGVPRHIVSHFRNYGDGLKPEQAAKLQDFFESKGIEFTDEDDDDEHQENSGTQHSTQPLMLPTILSDDGLTQRTLLTCRHFFIDERISDEQIREAGQRIEESFNQAKALLTVKLERQWLSDELNEATETKMRELWGHLARIGLVSLHLQGRVLINNDRILSDSLPAAKTFGDLLSDTYGEALATLKAIDQANTDEEASEAKS